MKKIITTLLLFMATITFSQEKGYLGVEFGSSTPMSDFGDDDFNNDESGFAKQGTYIGLTGTYSIKEQWGLAYNLRYQTNPLDNKKISDYFAGEFPNFANTVSSNSWTISGSMIGLYSSIPLFANVSWENKIMIGFLTAKNPYLKVELTDGTNDIKFEQKEAKTSSFTFGLSTGLKVDITSKLGVLFNIETMNATMKFKDVETYLNDTFDSKDSFNQGYSVLNFGAGLVYRFNS